MNRNRHTFQRGYDNRIDFSEQILIRIFYVFNDITFVNFVAEFEPRQTSKKPLQLNNEFEKLKEFKLDNPHLYTRLTKNGIDKEVVSKIKAQYIDAIKDYFQLIENKAEEFKYFETYCDSYARKLEKEKRRNAYPTPIVHFRNYLDKIAVYLRTLRVEINQLVREEQQRQETIPSPPIATPPTIQPKQTSYLQIDESRFKHQLDTLHNRLKAGDFISTKRHDTFSKVFAPDNTTKIDWIGSKVSLRYFIEKLYDEKILIDLGSKWKNAENIFTIKDVKCSGLRGTTKKESPSQKDKYYLDGVIKECFTLKS